MKRIALSIAAVTFTTVLTGCNPNKVDYYSITGNLTPELATPSQRPIDQHTDLAVTNNQNLRMFNDDLGRVFYTNHASTLSPYPITNLSGSPE